MSVCSEMGMERLTADDLGADDWNYPTRANRGLEWATQRLLMVSERPQKTVERATRPIVSEWPDLVVSTPGRFVFDHMPDSVAPLRGSPGSERLMG